MQLISFFIIYIIFCSFLRGEQLASEEKYMLEEIYVDAKLSSRNRIYPHIKHYLPLQ
jgi:hypothetical protein